jgi:hypothetical protein
MYPYLTFPLPVESMPCYPIQNDVATTPTSEKRSWENVNGGVCYLGCGPSALSSNPLTQTFRPIPCFLICQYPLIMALVTRVESWSLKSPSPAFLVLAYLSPFLRTPRHASGPCAHCPPRVFQRTTHIHSQSSIWNPTSRWLETFPVPHTYRFLLKVEKEENHRTGPINTKNRERKVR